MVKVRNMAPRKSIRRSIDRDDLSEVIARLGTWSFQATSARANKVGGHCPRKVLKMFVVSQDASKIGKRDNKPSPAYFIGEVTAKWSPKTPASCCSNICIASPYCDVS